METISSEYPLDLTARHICVPRVQWLSIKSSDADLKEAIRLMSENRFDVLPIEDSPDLPVREMFATDKRSAYSTNTVKRRHLEISDILPSTTPVSLLIREFSTSKKLFFFIVCQNKVMGLVTPSNLNSRPVRSWLFTLLCEYETSLGEVIRFKLSEEELLKDLPNSENGIDSLMQYQADKRNGIENHVVEYLYLSTLTNIFAKHKLYLVIGLRSRKEFEEYNSLNEIRKMVMHPVRSLITDEASIDSLSSNLIKLNDLLFRLRNR